MNASKRPYLGLRFSIVELLLTIGRISVLHALLCGLLARLFGCALREGCANFGCERN
jgi:hypothetical protein